MNQTKYLLVQERCAELLYRICYKRPASTQRLKEILHHNGLFEAFLELNSQNFTPSLRKFCRLWNQEKAIRQIWSFQSTNTILEVEKEVVGSNILHSLGIVTLDMAKGHFSIELPSGAMVQVPTENIRELSASASALSLTVAFKECHSIFRNTYHLGKSGTRIRFLFPADAPVQDLFKAIHKLHPRHAAIPATASELSIHTPDSSAIRKSSASTHLALPPVTLEPLGEKPATILRDMMEDNQKVSPTKSDKSVAVSVKSSGSQPSKASRMQKGKTKARRHSPAPKAVEGAKERTKTKEKEKEIEKEKETVASSTGGKTSRSRRRPQVVSPTSSTDEAEREEQLPVCEEGPISASRNTFFSPSGRSGQPATSLLSNRSGSARYPTPTGGSEGISPEEEGEGDREGDIFASLPNSPIHHHQPVKSTAHPSTHGSSASSSKKRVQGAKNNSVPSRSDLRQSANFWLSPPAEQVTARKRGTKRLSRKLFASDTEDDDVPDVEEPRPTKRSKALPMLDEIPDDLASAMSMLQDIIQKKKVAENKQKVVGQAGESEEICTQVRQNLRAQAEHRLARAEKAQGMQEKISQSYDRNMKSLKEVVQAFAAEIMQCFRQQEDLMQVMQHQTQVQENEIITLEKRFKQENDALLQTIAKKVQDIQSKRKSKSRKTIFTQLTKLLTELED